MANLNGKSIILRLYFAAVAAVTLFTLMFGAIDFLSIGLKSLIFRAADVPTWGITDCSQASFLKSGSSTGNFYLPIEEAAKLSDEDLKSRCEASNATAMEQYRREKANNIVRNLSLIIVSLPLFVIHFRTVYQDWNEDRKEK